MLLVSDEPEMNNIIICFSALCYVEAVRVANSHIAPLHACMLSYFSYILIQVSVCARYKLCFLRAFGKLNKQPMVTHAREVRQAMQCFSVHSRVRQATHF